MMCSDDATYGGPDDIRPLLTATAETMPTQWEAPIIGGFPFSLLN